jgi:5-methylcytosine-specific restriction endonuclease McrA
MAGQMLKLCAHPGCPNLVVRGRCLDHERKAREEKPKRVEHRGSAAKRGYDRTWRRCRKMVLNRQPLCKDCGCPLLDQPRKAHVHHKHKLRDAPEKRLDPDNLIAICDACHAKRTNRGE